MEHAKTLSKTNAQKLSKTNGHKSMWAEYDDPLSKKMNGMTAKHIIRTFSKKKLIETFTGIELLVLANRYDVEIDLEEELKKTKKRKSK